MFVFKRYEERELKGYNGNIPYELKREFHFSIDMEGLEDLDEKLFVSIDEKSIRFFWSNPEEEICESGKGKVVAAIVLTNPKDIGHDLLFFGESHRDSAFIKVSRDKREKYKGFVENARSIYHGFPFFDSCENWELSDEIIEKEFDKEFETMFLRICLLEFIWAFDTHDEVFAIIPEYDKIRMKLRESKVYNLFCAKLRYCMYRFKGRESKNEEEYSFVVMKYSDLLMDSDFNKIVPPTYYDIPRFFNNPEKELKLLERNSDYWRVDENVREKISKFFMTKHAVFESNMSNCSLAFQIVSFVLMTLAVLWSFFSCIWFDRDWVLVTVFFEYGVFFWLAVAVVLIGGVRLLLIGGALFGKARFRKAQLYHPRIMYLRVIVAMLMGWFTIAISEDLIKSQLDLSINMVLLALTVVVLVVVGILWGEVRQHSPYYCRVRLKRPPRINNAPKILTIIIPAMFWNLLLGIVMQRVTYDRLLEASGIVHSLSQEQLEDVDHYRQTIVNCIDILDEYDHAMDGILHDQGKVKMAVKMSKIDSSTTTARANVQSQRPEENMEKAREIHHGYQKLIEKWTNNQYPLTTDSGNTIWLVSQKDDSKWLAFIEKEKKHDSILAIPFIDDNSNVTWLESQKDDSIWLVKKEIVREGDAILVISANTGRIADTTRKMWSDPVFDELRNWCKRENGTSSWNEKIIGQKIDSVRMIKSDLRVLLMQVNRFNQWLNYPESLEKLGFYNNKEGEGAIDTIPTTNLYLAYVGSNVGHVHWKRRMDWHLSCVKPIILYPRMLIFHCLIVLVFAFVCQLIISDKSVTEPL